MSRVTCSVVEQGCEAPANLEASALPRRLPSCARCGEPVCRPCSTVRRIAGRRERVCVSCEAELDGTDAAFLRRSLRRAGPGSTAAGFTCLGGGSLTWNGGPIRLPLESPDVRP